MQISKVFAFAALTLLCGQPLLAQPRIIQTFAGTDFTFQSEGQLAVITPFGAPQAITVDSSGNLYIADQYYRLYLVGTDGTVQVLAGNGFSGCCSRGVPARTTRINSVVSVALGPDGSIY